MFNGLECPLCQTPYQDPRVLCCFHTLCSKCIKQNCSTPSIKCPLCEFTTVCQSVDLLPKNAVVETAIREKAGKRSCRNCSEKDGAVFCRQCSSTLCTECSTKIHVNEIFADHDLLPLAQLSSNTTSPNRQRDSPQRHRVPEKTQFQGGVLESCPRHHGELLTLYCGVCHHSLCKDCATDGIHRGHHPIYTTDSHAVTLATQEIPKVFSICDDIATKALRGIRAVDVALEDVSNRKVQCTIDIHADINEMIDRLNGRRKELLGQLDETVESKEQLLRKQRRTLELMLHNMNHTNAVALTLLSKGKQNQQREEALMRKLKVDERESNVVQPTRSLPLMPLSTKEAFSASTVCNIAAPTQDYLRFLLAQRIDLAACVDSTIRVTFDGKGDVLQNMGSVGEILAKQSFERHFHYTCIDDHEGLLYYLGCNMGIQLYKNPSRLGHVSVAASSVGYGRSENIVSATRSQFCTQSEEGSWVTVTLTRPFIVDHYTLQHDEYDADCHFLRSWVFQGFANSKDVMSANEEEEEDGVWVTLSSHIKDPTIQAHHPYGDWAVRPSPASCTNSTESTSSRLLPMSKYRILMTGPNSNGNHYLMLSAFELYGTLVG